MRGEREGQIELVGEREREQRGCLIQMKKIFDSKMKQTINYFVAISCTF